MSGGETRFRFGDSQRTWQKYCGFFDLSLSEFMDIQRNLLREEIELIAPTPIGKTFFKGSVPASIDEFRSQIPLTAYKDYARWFDERREDVLAEKPIVWICTTDRSGYIKWAPYTRRAYERTADSVMAGFILSCASKKGEVRIGRGTRLLTNLPPRPYLSGMLVAGNGFSTETACTLFLTCSPSALVASATFVSCKLS